MAAMVQQVLAVVLCAAVACVAAAERAAEQAAERAAERQRRECGAAASCGGCLARSFCVWCITKSRCTRGECGHDNAIYPAHIPALLAGAGFCPRLVDSDVAAIRSGDRESVIVRITQIHLYMAYTRWRCRIALAGRETTVGAMLLGDNVFCEETLFENTSPQPYLHGTIAVLWDNTKAFDGTVPIAVCRCDLAPDCPACD